MTMPLSCWESPVKPRAEDCWPGCGTSIFSLTTGRGLFISTRAWIEDQRGAPCKRSDTFPDRRPDCVSSRSSHAKAGVGVFPASALRGNISRLMANAIGLPGSRYLCSSAARGQRSVAPKEETLTTHGHSEHGSTTELGN